MFCPFFILTTCPKKSRFLLAQLHIDSLVDKTNPKLVKNALNSLPTGSSALDAAYEDAIRRIKNQKPGFRSLALQTLSWITYAHRLLTAAELRHALAIEIGEFVLDKDNLDEMEDIVSACAGLVAVDTPNDERKKVRLVHYTTQEFFQRTGPRIFPDATREIAAKCLTCLQFDVYQEGYPYDFGTTDQALERVKNLSKNPFIRYATQHWAHHALQCMEESIVTLMLGFLINNQMVSNAFTNHFYLNRTWERRFHVIHPCDKEWCFIFPFWLAMHYVAYLGPDMVISLVLKQGFEADIMDHCNRTSLFWAVEGGNEPVLDLMIKRKDVNINAVEAVHLDTPLHRAASDGNDKVVALLLTRSDLQVDLLNEYQRTPLCVATRKGRDEVVRQLLERKDVDTKVKDRNGNSLLHLAAESGSSSVLDQILMLEEMDINLQNLKAQTPLHMAVGHRSSSSSMITILLSQKDVAINAQDENGHTALMIAARYGDATAVRCLLAQKCIDMNTIDREGKTALSFAAQVGHETVVKFLLAEEEIEKKSIGGADTRLLMFAELRGRAEVVRSLLACEGVDVNFKARDGFTALLCTASRALVTGKADNVHGIPLWRDGSDFCDDVLLKLFLLRDGIESTPTSEYGTTFPAWAKEWEYIASFKQKMADECSEASN